MRGLEIRAVASHRELREFIELPYRLHSTSPQWVPPLRLERRMFLSRKHNAYFQHGDARYFLAWRGDRVVGRVSAQIDHAFNRFHGNTWGMFGFLELEEDPEALAGLLDAASGWLRARGRDRMVGPMDFTMNDEAGVLFEGFDREPMIKQPWHPPYYQRLCEEAGLVKAVDLWMWELHISDRTKIRPILFTLAEEANTKHGVTLRKMTRRRLRRDLDTFAEIYNSAWAENWGFVPYSDADLDHYAQEMQLVFDRDWSMVAEKDGQPVAMAMTFPDINQVLRRMKGRVLPFGWWHYLRRGAIIDRVRVGFLGVKPEYQHTGVAAQLYIEHFDVADRTHRKWGEMGWILETNRAMNRGMEAMGGRVVKRYRVYERVFDDAA
jgi:GNAT superfamily N-acetyltransferase